jgi:methionyl aminopeptidase
MITNDPKKIAQLKTSGKILATVLNMVVKKAVPGATAAELNKFAEEEIERMGGKPSFKGYGKPPFPAALCVSINDHVVHGVPTKEKVLHDGDIVGLDLGVNYQGCFTDMAITVPVGKVDAESLKLIEATKESLSEGLKQVKAGNFTGDIGHAMENVAKKYKYGAVRDLVGHGVGQAVHESPEVPGYGKPKSGTKLVEGMVLAIEPMVNIGSFEIIFEKDHWTVRTEDGSRSAHMEVTIRVTKDGYELITQP